MTALRCADLFAGAGGFTEGACSVGLDVVWAADHSPLAVEWHARNHPRVEHVCQDLRQADFHAVPDVDVVLAGPACQGHSEAGRGSASARARAKHDADRSTAWAVVDCAEARRPRVLVVENVPRMRRWVLYSAWCSALRALGYMLTEWTLNAADYGVAQERRRLFVVGRLDGRALSPPVRRRGWLPAESLLDESDGHRWARCASKPSGVRDRVARGRAACGPRFLVQHVTGHAGRLLSRPIGTITCAAQHWHLVDGEWMRPLSPRELARGQGLRDTFELPDAIAPATRLVGNAVPVPLAAAVIRAAVVDVSRGAT